MSASVGYQLAVVTRGKSAATPPSGKTPRVAPPRAHASAPPSGAGGAGRFLRRRAFALLMACLAAALVLGYRHLVGAPLGPSVSPDGTELRSGIILNPPDYLTYVAWAQQARHGHWWMIDLYTMDEHEALYFNPFFFALGQLAAVSGWDVIYLLNLAALAGAFGATLFIHEAALAARLSPAAARWACAFSAFTTGFSGLLQLLPGGDATWRSGIDQIYADLMPITSYLAAPYHAIGWFMVALLAWLVFYAERPASAAGRWLLILAGGLFSALMVSVRPYEFVFMLAGYALFAALSVLAVSRGGQNIRLRERLALLAAMTLFGGGALAWSHHVAQQPIWDNFAAKSLDIPMARSAWIVGFGAALWIALAAMALALRRWRAAEPLLWPALWSACGLVAVVGVAIPQTKLAGGLYFALCLLAASAMDAFARLLSAGLGRAGYAVMVGAGIVIFASGWLTLVKDFAHPRIEAHDRLLSELIDRSGLKGKDGVTVLCDPAVGTRLPGLYGFRVYCGHWSLTNDHNNKRYFEFLAGMCPPAQAAPPLNPREIPEQFHNLLDDAHCQFVLVEKGMPARVLLAWDAGRFRLLDENQAWALFADSRFPPAGN